MNKIRIGMVAILIALVSLLPSGMVLGAEPIDVVLDAPIKLVSNSRFTMVIDVAQIDNLDAACYTILYDPLVLTVDNVTWGVIGDADIPVDAVNAGNGFLSVVQNVPGLAGVSGSGYLASVEFYVRGAFGTKSAITSINCSLSDTNSNLIEAKWIGCTVEVSAIRGDSNGDGILNAQDITKLERIIAALDLPYCGADATLDSKYNALDITKLERMLVGLQ